MKTERPLAKEQFYLMEDIMAKANINIVTCGNCGSIILHEMKSINEDNSIQCWGCSNEM